jgi:hypothetical protein
MDMKMLILLTGIKRKLKRGENLDNILTSYVNLTEDEKQEIREHLAK